MDLEDVEYQLSKAKLLGCKGTTGTQASFMELFDGDHEKCKALDKKIAEKMDIPPSTVRSLLLPKAEASAKKKENIISTLKDQVEEKTYLDIGKGVGAQLGISDTSLKNAVYQLQQEGYKVQTIKVEQATNPKQKTTIQVLTKDDVPWQEVNENRDLIRSPSGIWMENNGETMRGIREPVSIDSKRIAVNYADTGNGLDLDGTIFIRPGVADLALGDNHYAQVRIAVDGTHYLKGMALYSDKKNKEENSLLRSKERIFPCFQC